MHKTPASYLGIHFPQDLWTSVVFHKFLSFHGFILTKLPKLLHQGKALKAKTQAEAEHSEVLES